MAPVRKLVVDAIRTVMSDEVYGFNATFAGLMENYGIDRAIDIKWTQNSGSVFYGSISSGDARRAGLREQVTLRISTTATMWTGYTKGSKWCGVVEVGLVFAVRYSHEEREDDGIEDYQAIENYVAAIEDAVIDVFQRRAIDWGALNVVYSRPPDCPALGDAQLFADGWEQEVPIRVGFRVDINY
jgi:hypothetical protein